MKRNLTNWAVLAATGAIMGLLLSGCAWSIGSDKAHTAVLEPTRGQELIDLQKAKDQGAITEEEYMRIDKLNRYRNQLLHVKKGKVAWFFTMNETEKGEVIASAWDSASSTFSALIRLTEAYRAALGLKLLSPLPSTVNSE